MTGYGPVIRRLRGERGWSQRMLAEMAAVPIGTVGAVERGTTPSASTLYDIATALGVDGWLIAEEAGIPTRERGAPPKADRADIATSVTYSVPASLRDAVRVVAACHGVTPSAWVQEALRERLGRSVGRPPHSDMDDRPKTCPTACPDEP